jgi:hypothetical protein
MHPRRTRVRAFPLLEPLESRTLLSVAAGFGKLPPPTQVFTIRPPSLPKPPTPVIHTGFEFAELVGTRLVSNVGALSVPGAIAMFAGHFDQILLTPDGEQYHSFIDWGDGATSSNVLSAVNGHVVFHGDHTYASPGTYQITGFLRNVFSDRPDYPAQVRSVARIYLPGTLPPPPTLPKFSIPIGAFQRFGPPLALHNPLA